MNADLNERTLKFVNAEHPLGPVDAHEIDDPEVAARLFDPHNTSFNRLLRKDISVVIGRRGSGKTALLESYQHRPFFKKSAASIANDARLDVGDYKVVLPVSSHQVFEKMQACVAGPKGELRPIESVVEDWEDLITKFFLVNISDKYRYEENSHLDVVNRYINSPKLAQELEAQHEIHGEGLLRVLLPSFFKDNDKFPSRKDAVDHCVQFLTERKVRAIIIFDSMDEYEIGNSSVDRTVGALLRFISRFNRIHNQIKIKLGFPSEVFPEILAASANSLKDMLKFDQVNWSAAELAQIGAHRYRIFLELHDRESFALIRDVDLNSRDGVWRFWSNFLSTELRNRYGHSEFPLTFILRHTQLLPRQFFGILQGVVLESFKSSGGYRSLTNDAILSSISRMETIVAGEIIQGFKYVFPFANQLSKTIFGSFDVIFNYDQLGDGWRKVGRPFIRRTEADFELIDFNDMLLRMGIIGIVVNETDRYVEAEFAYNKLAPPAVGKRTDFAVHPIFSRHFSCKRNPKMKAILPVGASIW
jgi:hypothetical protein